MVAREACRTAALLDVVVDATLCVHAAHPSRLAGVATLALHTLLRQATLAVRLTPGCTTRHKSINLKLKI